ncbi:MAG: hypothetical protein WCJ58_04315 [bacterium]
MINKLFDNKINCKKSLNLNIYSIFILACSIWVPCFQTNAKAETLENITPITGTGLDSLNDANDLSPFYVKGNGNNVNAIWTDFTSDKLLFQTINSSGAKTWLNGYDLLLRSVYLGHSRIAVDSSILLTNQTPIGDSIPDMSLLTINNNGSYSNIELANLPTSAMSGKILRNPNDGSVYASWSDCRHSGQSCAQGQTNTDIYMEKLDQNGNKLWSDPTPYIQDSWCSNNDDPPTAFTLSSETINHWSDCLEWCQDNMTVGQPICKYDGSTVCQTESAPAGDVANCIWVDSPSNGYPKGGQYGLSSNPNYYGKKIHTSLTTDTYNYVLLDTISQPDGGMFYVYNTRTDTPSYQRFEYLQKIDSNGNKLWGTNGIDITTLEDENFYLYGSIGSDNNGGEFILWDDGDPNNTGNYGYYLQRLDADGNKVWPNHGKLLNEGGEVSSIEVEIYDDSSLLVYWSDYRNDDGSYSNSDVFAQRLNFNGEKMWAENGVEVFINSPWDQFVNGAKIQGDGTVIIETSDFRNDLDGNYPYITEIAAQKLNAGGNRLWGDTGILLTNVNIEGSTKYSNTLSLVEMSGNDLLFSWGDDRYNPYYMEKEFYNIFTKAYQVDLGSSAATLDVVDSIGKNIKLGTSYGISKNFGDGSFTDTLTVQKQTGEVIAKIDSSLTSDLDWTTVTADSSISEGKAFIHNLTSSEGADTNFTLYVPIPVGPTPSYIMICPNAESLADLVPSCPGALQKIEADSDVQIVTIDSQDYWEITGLSGTGAFGSVDALPTPTPTPTVTPTPTATLVPTATSVPAPTSTTVPVPTTTAMPTNTFTPTSNSTPTLNPTQISLSGTPTPTLNPTQIYLSGTPTLTINPTQIYLSGTPKPNLNTLPQTGACLDDIQYSSSGDNLILKYQTSTAMLTGTL